MKRHSDGKHISSSYNTRTGLERTAYFLKVIAACLAAVVIPLVLFTHTPRFSAEIYLPVHTVLEFSSIVVSFSVFTIGWYGYRQTGNRRDLFIAVAYMTVALVDLAHTLSYSGVEPGFLTRTNTIGGAAAYWIAARLFDALALLGAAFVSANSRSRFLQRRVLVPAAVLLVTVTIVLITTYHEAVSLAIFDTRLSPPRLTPLKIALEYFVIALYIAAFVAFNRGHLRKFESVLSLQTALVIAVFSELCFTLYNSPYDSLNLTGHVLKVAAYYFVLRALFVSSLQRPYEELTQAREEAAEHVQELEKSLTSIGNALSSSLDRDKTLELIAELAADITHAPTTIVAEIRDGKLIPIAGHGAAHYGNCPVTLEKCLAKTAIIQRAATSIGNLHEYSEMCSPKLAEAGIRSVLSAPIMHDGRLLGIICAHSPSPKAFGEREERLLGAFAQHAAIALRNTEIFQHQRHIADTLQRNLLPGIPSSADGFQISAHYAPAFDEALIGGDFYDVFEISDHRLGLLIGDVSGKGLSAAVHTAMIKYAVRAYATEHDSPAEVLQNLNKAVMNELANDMFVTLLYAVIDTTTGDIVYASAGHENPILYEDASSSMRVLESSGPLVGLDLPGGYSEWTIRLEQGDLLVLYTDGLTESRRGEELFGQDGILVTLSEYSGAELPEVVSRLFERAVEFAGHRQTDDVAIVAVKRAQKNGQ